MTSPFDLDAYFARIGFTGAPRADLATLSAIHGLHTAAIPFENLNPLMGLPVSLEPDDLAAKLIGQARGGYCFEQNAVLKAALEAIGFSVIGLGARVRWMAPPDRPVGPRSHMTLKVDAPGGPYLADVGFGGHMLGAPIRLMAGEVQTQAASTLRLEETEAGALTLQTLLPTGWQDMYRFTLEPQHPSDYAVSNWFTATHPTSIFTNGLLAERLTPDVRRSLFNRNLTERWADGRTVTRTLESAAELAEVLGDGFGLTPPAPIDAIWAKLPSA
jgi:N-hydroxyarylamine O-acetyltransferase